MTLSVKSDRVIRVLLSVTAWTPPTRLLCPCDFPGKIIGVGCHFLLQEIFLTQGLSPGRPYCRQTLYHLSHQGSPLLHENPVSVDGFIALEQVDSSLVQQ